MRTCFCTWHTHSYTQCARNPHPPIHPPPPFSSLTTVRVLVISRNAYATLERSYPIASRIVLENLRHHTEEAVGREFPGFTGTSDFADLLAKSPGSLLYSWASPELVELMMKAKPGAEGGLAGGSGLSVRQVGCSPYVACVFEYLYFISINFF